uniref:Uncharacterized protein n=1 Tax=Oryza punctata TaxID=4537 RepID=A0A0E0L491_ORYPU
MWVGLGIGGMSRKHKLLEVVALLAILELIRALVSSVINNLSISTTLITLQTWVGLGNGAPCDKASTWKLRKGSKSLDKVWLFHRFCLDCLCCPLSRHFEEFLPYGQLSDHYPLYKVCSVPLV